ncbi:NTP transferase domain-containing protein [Arthrobacter sp. STN4]|uniref:molybdenum cofactor guanylyltransferase n=1 Tax=Arthrobacter sp. STN4 TaxID=2923276 RepID=UPI00211A0606|nr:NTP transferase domain-containing protein [Arthrobacter sp. STN4]MCQ9165765.1 NTP transferase domain-containing protein [Arthrobacter sp. STN4]
MQAVILAGGLSRRLGGVAKAGLLVNGETLLAHTLRAAQAVVDATSAGNARGRTAVVGPVGQLAAWLGPGRRSGRLELVQEDPPYSGPAAGIAAGISALDGTGGRVLVLACDMPQAGPLAKLLAEAAAGCGASEAVMAVDGGRRQPLAAIYPLAALQAAVAEARAAHRLENASVFSLLASVNIKECAVPAGLAADIDTWDDARLHGIGAPL